jgi:hypothetical protein
MPANSFVIYVVAYNQLMRIPRKNVCGKARSQNLDGFLRLHCAREQPGALFTATINLDVLNQHLGPE